MSLQRPLIKAFPVLCPLSQSQQPFYQALLQQAGYIHRQAMELTLVGGESYIKPCIDGNGISLAVIPRDRVLVF